MPAATTAEETNTVSSHHPTDGPPELPDELETVAELDAVIFQTIAVAVAITVTAFPC
jgi:hypothetical protein